MGEGSREKKKKKKDWSVWGKGQGGLLYIVFKPIETNFHCFIMINQ